MELENGILLIDDFFTFTIGIVVLFIGKRVNDAIGFLREFSIPEPVAGGLIFSVLFGLVYAFSGVEVEFDLAARDFLLGHLNILGAVIFDEMDGVFSDACNKAIEFGKPQIFREDWKRVLEPDEIAESIRRIT